VAFKSKENKEKDSEIQSTMDPWLGTSKMMIGYPVNKPSKKHETPSASAKQEKQDAEGKSGASPEIKQKGEQKLIPLTEFIRDKEQGQAEQKKRETLEALLPIVEEKVNQLEKSTSNLEELKQTLEKKGIAEFNEELVLFASILVRMGELAEAVGDEKLKMHVLNLEDRFFNKINKNIETNGSQLGYNYFHFSLDELDDKDLNGVKEVVGQFGVELNLEAIFGAANLSLVEYLFASTRSINANAPEEKKKSAKEKAEKGKSESAEEKTNGPVVPVPQVSVLSPIHRTTVLQPEQSVVKQQPVSKEEKQNEKYHSALRENGKKIGIVGAVVGALGAALFLGGFYYLPLAAFGLFGEGLAILGVPLLFVGGVTWVAGVINEAEHNDHISEAIKEHLVGAFTWLAGKIDEGIHKLAHREEKKEQEEEQEEKQAPKGKQTDQLEEEKKQQVEGNQQQGNQNWPDYWGE